MAEATCDGKRVELRDHVGTLVTTTGDTQVNLGQWFVLLDGLHVGYLRYEPGSRVVWIEELSEADAAAICTACEILNGWRPGSAALMVRQHEDVDDYE